MRVRWIASLDERIGFFEDICPRWGIAIVWEDGSRAWVPYKRLCPDAEDRDRLVCELLNPEDFIKDASYALAPKELGREWLPNPPARSAPVPRPAESGLPMPPPSEWGLPRTVPPFEFGELAVECEED